MNMKKLISIFLFVFASSFVSCFAVENRFQGGGIAIGDVLNSTNSFTAPITFKSSVTVQKPIYATTTTINGSLTLDTGSMTVTGNTWLKGTRTQWGSSSNSFFLDNNSYCQWRFNGQEIIMDPNSSTAFALDIYNPSSGGTVFACIGGNSYAGRSITPTLADPILLLSPNPAGYAYNRTYLKFDSLTSGSTGFVIIQTSTATADTVQIKNLSGSFTTKIDGNGLFWGCLPRCQISTASANTVLSLAQEIYSTVTVSGYMTVSQSSGIARTSNEDSITVPKSGVYLAYAQTSLENTSVDAGNVYEISFLINGSTTTATELTESERTISNSSIANLVTRGYFALTAGDRISFAVLNRTDDDDCTIKSANLLVQWAGW